MMIYSSMMSLDMTVRSSICKDLEYLCILVHHNACPYLPCILVDQNTGYPREIYSTESSQEDCSTASLYFAGHERNHVSWNYVPIAQATSSQAN